MPIKYIPFIPEPIDGQAILDNFTRTKRVLSYRDNSKVFETVKRGMPLYELELKEKVRHKLSDNKFPGNLVIRGECISACAFLKDQGIKVDLVYIDPPFASGADYAKKIYIRRNPKVTEAIEKAEEKMDDEELKMFEEKMYGDVWNKEAYLNWMYENLLAIKSIMSPTASIYVHLDWHIGHYVKILLDEIFGEDNFRNEIIWWYPSGQDPSKNFNRKHDNIFWYSNSNTDWIFNFDAVAIPYTKGQEERFTEWDEEKQNWYYPNINPRGESVRTYKKSGIGEYDVWNIGINASEIKEIGYKTIKPSKLLEKVIKASSNEKMIVADFFGGSGVTAKVSNDLNRNFIHVDVGLNSIQTTRDRLIEAKADFDILEIKDGVNLFRNPAQTMDKLAVLISGLQRNKKYNSEEFNEDEKSLSKFWFGSVTESKLGKIPVYVPNLLDHTQKVLDIPIINKILNEELPKLDDAKKVIVYYIDLEDKNKIENFIKENNVTEIEVELKDLKQVLDEVVVDDLVEYELREISNGYEIEITKFISDRLLRKIDEYNQKKKLNTKTKLDLKTEEENNSEDENENGIEENGNGNENDTEEDNGNGTGNGNGNFKEIEISEEGLELIELISLNCTNKEGIWNSDSEIKIDKNGYVIRNGEKTKTFWDAKIKSSKKPLRMKIRNIAGDEIIINFNDTAEPENYKKKVKSIGKKSQSKSKKNNKKSNKSSSKVKSKFSDSNEKRNNNKVGLTNKSNAKKKLKPSSKNAKRKNNKTKVLKNSKNKVVRKSKNK